MAYWKLQCNVLLLLPLGDGAVPHCCMGITALPAFGLVQLPVFIVFLLFVESFMWNVNSHVLYIFLTCTKMIKLAVCVSLVSMNFVGKVRYSGSGHCGHHHITSHGVDGCRHKGLSEKYTNILLFII